MRVWRTPDSNHVTESGERARLGFSRALSERAEPLPASPHMRAGPLRLIAERPAQCPCLWQRPMFPTQRFFANPRASWAHWEPGNWRMTVPKSLFAFSVASSVSIMV